MPTWRTCLLHAASLALALALAQPAAAQEAAGAEESVPTQTVQPTQEAQASTGNAVAAFSEALDKWAGEIEAKEQAIASEATTDEGLRAIPEELELLRESIVDQKALLKPKLQAARERLAKIGPPPEDGAPAESSEIAKQRKRLEAEVAAIDGKLKQADILFVRAGQLIDNANEERRERFTESLFRPVPNLYSYVLPAGLERLPAQTEKIFGALTAWLAHAWDKGPLFLVLLFLVSGGAGLAMRSFVRNMAARLDAKQRADLPDEPTIQERGTWALRKSIRSAVPFWVGLLVFYLIAAAAGLADPTPGAFLLKAIFTIGWAFFLVELVHHSLVPEERGWRVVPSSDVTAWRLASLLWAVIAVWLTDQILVQTDTVVFAPYQVSVLRSLVFSALYGALLVAILLVIQSGATSRTAAFSGWQGWLFSFVGAIAGLTLIAAVLGYESLAHFIGAHAVSTAGVLWIMYLMHLAAESISSVSVISGRAIDDTLEEDSKRDAPSLLTIRLIVSVLLDIAILAVGVTVLLLLWRFDWIEVKSWIQAAFFGFEFGNLRLSLQSVLIALGVFALGLMLTRFVQRWLSKRIFTGRRTESGMNESVRVGIGYLGFVIAALAGISYLGVDFSNLAIVAGALSVGIGFGLQSIFNNFVSGLILLVERPIKIGDYIQVGEEEGTVKKISVRSTEIETIHRQSVIIPNATLITDPVVNWMHNDKTCRLDLPVGVDYGTDVELLRTTLLDVAKAHRNALKQPAPLVHFASFGDSSLDFELRVFLRDVRQRITSSSELRFDMLAALRKAGISIPFPQRDIHIKGEQPSGSPKAGSARQHPS